jgi:hypothetical protein
VSLLYRNKGFYTAFNASNLLDKNTDKFSGIEPVLLRNYQIYSGMVIKGATNQENLSLLSIFSILKVIKDQVPMLILNTEGLTTMTIIIG